MTELKEAMPQEPDNKSKSKSKSKKSRKPNDSEKTRRLRMEAKAIVLKLEEHNNDHIYLFASTKGWWKTSMNSLLFYLDLVAPALPKPPTRMQDKDFNLTARYGVIPFSSVEKFLETITIAKANIVSDDTLDFERYSSCIRAFKLPAAYSDKEIRMLRTADASSRDRFNSRIIENIPDAELATKIRTAITICFHLAMRVDQRVRKVIGNRFFDNAQALLSDYQDYASCVTVPEQTVYLETMFRHTRNALDALNIYNYTHVFEPAAMEPATFALADVRDYVRRELEKRKGIDAIKAKYDEVKNQSEEKPL